MEQILMKKIEELCNSCADKLGMRIISVDYVKEFGTKILRVIASKDPVFTIDDSSALNRMISDELDKVDLIDEEYYLEVSSEGLEKELRNDDELKEAVGTYICIKTYEKVEGKKELYGDLIDFDSDRVIIDANIKGKVKQIAVNRKIINLIRLAVKF